MLKYGKKKIILGCVVLFRTALSLVCSSVLSCHFKLAFLSVEVLSLASVRAVYISTWAPLPSQTGSWSTMPWGQLPVWPGAAGPPITASSAHPSSSDAAALHEAGGHVCQELLARPSAVSARPLINSHYFAAAVRAQKEVIHSSIARFTAVIIFYLLKGF